MRFRLRTLATSTLLFAAACAAPPLADDPDDPVDPGDPGSQPGTGRPITSVEQAATGLGMSIMSSDAYGAPRMIRAIVPRSAAPNVAAGAAAQAHLAALAPLYIQQARPMALTEIGVQELRNGARVARFNQTVNGYVVDGGEVRVLLHQNSSLAAVSGTLLAAPAKPTFVSSAPQALGHALDKLGASQQLAITEGADSGGWRSLEVASSPQVTVTTARARPQLSRVAGQLIPSWAVEVEADVAPTATSDSDLPTYSYHRYVFADADGRMISDRDLVAKDAFVYRVYAETTGNRRPFDGPLESFAPHPTGVPDGSAPGRISSNLVVMEAFNAPHDPWLPNNATTTFSNHAEVFADLDASRTFTPGDFRPEVRSGRVLNYNYNHDLGPLDSPDQSKAAAVNTFFVANWQHDWWYDSGFTEATGNAQTDNFGRGGIGGDPLLISAQAGATTGLRNNADMGTPADGARPRMRMFLWTAGTNTALDTGTATPRAEPFNTGPRSFDITGDLILAVDGTAPSDDGCQAYTNTVTGKIVAVNFSGACNSAATVTAARAAGAAGVIIIDPVTDDPRTFGGSAAANLPGLAIGKTDGAALLARLAVEPVTVHLTSAPNGPERDGDFDNGIIAHEWGHYLHHRLADCGAQQCSGMSEGWGDFNALLMMVREGDNRDGVYAMAPYALSNGTPDVAYFGIRRFPYSRDRTKNDLSFRHIGNENALPTSTPGGGGANHAEVHATGEIWATMMWEAFNVLADEHGVTVARRRISDYVVAGLLLTPPDATFTEGRDGILAAASALDTDDMILMAAAFAGRGAGSCAKSPDVNSATNFGVVESGTLSGKLSVGGASLIDDGISCDHDGYLDPGESGQLRVTLANNGILAAENITVTATTTSPGVRVGAPLRMSLLQPFANANLTIPVTLLPSAPRNAVISINVHVTGEQVCDRNGVDAVLQLRTGVDDSPNASAIDRADTRLSVWTPTGTFADAIWGRAIDGSFNQMFFGADAGLPTDTQFQSPALTVSATAPLVFSYKHAYSLEASGGTLFDGGMVEISLNGGTTWSDVTAFGVNPGYNGALGTTSDNPLGGRQAYSGVSTGFPALNTVSLNFGTLFAGLPVMFRFRIGTDAAAAQAGWLIDDVGATGITNTPFPQLVSEPATCTARERPVNATSAVLETHQAPATSLRSFDAQACILNDTL